MKEKWMKLAYPSLPDELNRFEISTYGRLKNVKTNYIYNPSVLNTGYLSVRTTLGNRNNKIHILVHKAVAYTFLENPNNLPEVNHKDGNKENNHVSNLEWCTSHENQQHKYDFGLFDKNKIMGENNGASKLTWNDINFIREHYIPYSKIFGTRAMARKFNVSHATMLAIIHNKTWRNSNVS